MMMGSSREGGNYQAKQEDAAAIDMNKFSKVAAASSTTTTSRQWSSAFRNPRIVRVSRSFGGKDRHSKVCTIRGLRDRRIRLSVPTAIQLYDLQDKLGLTQPSKVIDWLLEATKFDIDKLPPLQFPQSFSQFHQYHHPAAQTLLPLHDPSSAASLSLGPLYDPNSSTFMGIQNLMAAKSRFWEMDKGKELAERGYNDITENNVQNSLQQQVSTQRLFPMGTTTTQSHHSPNLLNINAMSSSYNNNNNNYHNSDPSGLSLSSQFGSHGGILFHNSQHQQVDPSNNNGLQFLQPSLPLLPSAAGSQLLFGPSSAATVPSSLLTTPFVTVENNNNDYPRSQFNHFQFLNSSSSSSSSGSNIPLIPSLHHSLINSTPVRPFPSLLFSSKLLDSDNNNNSNRSSQQDYKGSGSARS